MNLSRQEARLVEASRLVQSGPTKLEQQALTALLRQKLEHLAIKDPDHARAKIEAAMSKCGLKPHVAQAAARSLRVQYEV